MLLATVMTPCYVARLYLEPRYVAAAAPQKQAGRQFRLDFALFLLGGLGIALVNRVFFGFPLVASGSKLVMGLGAIGLFTAIDLSLLRERDLLLRAAELGVPLHPPDELSPMSRVFSLVGTSIMLLIGVTLMLLFWRDIHWLSQHAHEGRELFAQLQEEVFFEVAVVLGGLLLLTIRIIMSYAKNLHLLFQNETQVLEQVSKGQLNGVVPVLTNDEFGFIAGHTNAMIEGLRDRMRMREGLIVAREVQQNLLPSRAPHVPGVHISGSSLYSDETGGDLFDFYEQAGPGGRYVGVVIGDVSGHGVGSALIMASARAMLRLRMAQGSPLDACITDVNRQLARDLFGTGRFMTLLALLVNKDTGAITLCSAGHDPAIFYDSAADVFGEYKAPGLPLGVDPDWSYECREYPPLRSGEVLLLGTDGIWEAGGKDGSMYGKRRLREAIRQYTPVGAEVDGGAQGLERYVFAELQRFRGGKAPEDDITVVILRGTRRDGGGAPEPA